MDSTEFARLIYFGILLVAVAGTLVTGTRQSLGRTVQQALIWTFLFAACIATYGLWPDLRRALFPGEAMVRAGALEIAVADDGHFYVDASVNGTPVTFLVDTGAWTVVLTREDAQRAGIKAGSLRFTERATTANGPVATAPVRIDQLVLGPYTDNGVRASVSGGDLDVSLLGMSYLDLYGMDLTGDRLILKR